MSLKQMSMRNKILWAVGVLAIAAVVAVTDTDEGEAPAPEPNLPAPAANGPAPGPYAPPRAPAEPAQASGGQTQAGVGPAPSARAPMRPAVAPAAAVSRSARDVTVYDRGLGMPSSTMRIPAGWDFQHDVAFDPSAGGFTSFKMVAVGPRNQYIRSYLGHFPYGSVNGAPFERALQQAVDHVLGVERLQNLRLGRLEPYPQAMNDPEMAAMSQRLASRGQKLELLEAGFTGERGGRRYQGSILFTHMFSPGAGFGQVSPGRMVFALAEDFPEADRVADAIDASRVRNPEYGRAMAGIIERLRQQSDAYSRQMMDQSAQAHQRRMADQKAAFASHQRNMAGLNQIQDVAHESYMKTLRSRGSFASVGSDYGGQQAVVDQIHGRSSFADPWTNSQIALDGQYKYNFTNGLGDYYRTNDPGFDPASLQGDWRAIQPLGP